MSSDILWGLFAYLLLAGITAGVYSGMARAQKRDAPGNVLTVAGLLWPIMLPFAVGHLLVSLFV